MLCSCSLVGYGDISPKDQFARLIAVFYLPLCVGIMAHILGKFSKIYIKQKAKEAEKDFLNRRLSVRDLRKMDVEGNGNVSYNEFLVFMLVTMGKVDMSDIQQLERLYKKLDEDHSGNLSIQDLHAKAYGPTMS